jgi:hypothetical protein
MAELVKEGARDFQVRQAAIDILIEAGVRPRDYLAEIRALFEWVQRNVRYTRDPVRVEVLHSARRMLQLRAGDCDDMAILLGAMLQAVGHPVRIVLTGPDPLRPCFFSHVYLHAHHRGVWIPLDPTMPHPMGWESRSPVREIHPIDVGTGATSCPAGLAGCACGCGGRPGGCAAGRSRGSVAGAGMESLRGDLDRGLRLLRRFGRAGTPRIEQVRHRRLIPPVVVQLGDLVGLIYRSDRGNPPAPRSYLHVLGRPARLASDVAGRSLYVIGGSLRVTSRGIEG